MKYIKILLILFLFTSCNKDIIEPVTPPPTQPTDIFSLTQSTIGTDGNIDFNLKTEGLYTLTILNTETGDVLSREVFYGKLGKNSLKLYTKSLPVRYLYLSLEDKDNIQIGKTLLLIN